MKLANTGIVCGAAIVLIACHDRPHPGEVSPKVADTLRWQQDDGCIKGDASGACELYFVSLIELIANPDRFDGKTVQASGYLSLEFEGTAMYVSQADYVNSVNKNAIWLDIPAPHERPPELQLGLHKCYFMVRGTFRRSIGERLGLASGVIENIKVLDPASPRNGASGGCTAFSEHGRGT